MNRDEQRRRVPTSDELEQEGRLAPAAGPAKERRGGLLRFFRARRFRVSDDVAARKHVGEARPPLPVTERESGQQPGAASTRPTGTPDPLSGVNTIAPRKIRIDPSVKERRGLGRPNDSRESSS